MAKLITEFTSIENLNVIVEDIVNAIGEKEKKYKLRGPMIVAEEQNKNGRIYPLKTLTNAVNIYKQDFIDKNRSLGSMEHNATPTVEMPTVSHIIESLVMKDNIGYGVARVLPEMPMGKIAIALIKEGILLGMSSRCVGNVGDKGVVADDLVMCSIDMVHSPSAPGAFMEGVYESKEWLIQGNQILEVAVGNLTKKMDKTYNSKVVLQYMTEFMDDIKNKGKRKSLWI